MPPGRLVSAQPGLGARTGLIMGVLVGGIVLRGWPLHRSFGLRCSRTRATRSALCRSDGGSESEHPQGFNAGGSEINRTETENLHLRDSSVASLDGQNAHRGCSSLGTRTGIGSALIRSVMEKSGAAEPHSGDQRGPDLRWWNRGDPRLRNLRGLRVQMLRSELVP